MTPARQDVAAEHLGALAGQRFAVLATVHPDGRPQLSLVQQHAHEGVADVSLTAARVKTRNLREDPRAALLVGVDGALGPAGFVVAEGRVELTEPSEVPGDEVGRQLVELYRALAGEHPDWDDYLRAMVADRRLRARIHIERTYAGGG